MKKKNLTIAMETSRPCSDLHAMFYRGKSGAVFVCLFVFYENINNPLILFEYKKRRVVSVNEYAYIVTNGRLFLVL